MKELLNSSLYFGVTVSIAGYGIGLFLKRKLKWGFLNPLLLAIIFCDYCIAGVWNRL